MPSFQTDSAATPSGTKSTGKRGCCARREDSAEPPCSRPTKRFKPEKDEPQTSAPHNPTNNNKKNGVSSNLLERRLKPLEPTHAIQTPSKPPSKSLQQEEEEIIQSSTSSPVALVTIAPETNKTDVSLQDERLQDLETMVEYLVPCREPSLGSLPNQPQQQQQLERLQDAVQWQDHQVSGWLDQLEVVLERKDQQYAALVHRMDALEQRVCCCGSNNNDNNKTQWWNQRRAMPVKRIII